MRISRILCLCLVAALLQGCEESETPPIPYAQMAKMLIDLQFSEVYSVGLGYDSLEVKRKFLKNPDSLALFYQSVFAHHHVSAKEFTDAMDWFRNRPEKMDSLMMFSLQEFDEQKRLLSIPDYEEGDQRLKEEEEQDKERLRERWKEQLKEHGLSENETI